MFDKKLRLLVLDALERIEVAIRVDIAHLLGERDTFAYEHPKWFDGKFTQPKGPHHESDHDRWLSRHNRLVKRSNEPFIKHYKTKYGHIFGTWLRSLNYIRNLCAHHSRLWNRNVVEQAKLPPAPAAGDLTAFIGKPNLIARPFMYFCILQWLMRKICPNSRWHHRLKSHLLKFPDDSNQIYARLPKWDAPLGGKIGLFGSDCHQIARCTIKNPRVPEGRGGGRVNWTKRQFRILLPPLFRRSAQGLRMKLGDNFSAEVWIEHGVEALFG